jgi:hypothetical protein
MRTEFGRAAGANSLTCLNGMRRRHTTAPIACVLLIALFQVIVIINPKVPGSRPGRPTKLTGRISAGSSRSVPPLRQKPCSRIEQTQGRSDAAVDHRLPPVIGISQESGLRLPAAAFTTMR